MNEFKFKVGEEVIFKNPFSDGIFSKFCKGIITECIKTATQNKYKVSQLSPYNQIESIIIQENEISHFGEFNLTEILPKLEEIVCKMEEQWVKGRMQGGEIQLNISGCSIKFKFQ